MKCLIAEDNLMESEQTNIPSQFDCDIAVNGQEAIDLF